MAGLLGGVFAFNMFQPSPSHMTGIMVIDELSAPDSVSHTLPKIGEIDGIQKIDTVETRGAFVNGRVTMGIPDREPQTRRLTKIGRAKREHAGSYEQGGVQKQPIPIPNEMDKR